ncbi:MAG TPA: hypothetical protein VET23_08510 [Chitinophagaceae bacterium]|nr:hypothetical protein [Chitinophagaceae bacterium]
MAEKIIKLTEEEMTKLKILFFNSKVSVRKRILLMIVIILLFSLIPIRWNPFVTIHEEDNPNHNLFQNGGWGWLTFFMIGLGLFSFFTVRTKKIFQLKKDLQEGEKMEVDVVVTGKNSDTRYDYYYMRVSGDTLKSKKIIVTEEQFNQFEKGEKLTINVYKNSMILVSSVLK